MQVDDFEYFINSQQEESDYKRDVVDFFERERYLLSVPRPQDTPSLPPNRPQPVRVVAGYLVA